VSAFDFSLARPRFHSIDNAIDYARFSSRSHDAVIRVYDDPGAAIETRSLPLSCRKRPCNAVDRARTSFDALAGKDKRRQLVDVSSPT
jgi:hypothetical protein